VWVYLGWKCIEFVGEDEEVTKAMKEESIRKCRIQLCEHKMELTLNMRPE
jgi:hypothetical protein